MIKIVDIRSRIGCAETREIFGQLDYPPEIRATKTAEIAKEYREHTEQLLFAAELDGELVGFIGIRLRVPDEATIRHIAVHRDHRRQGIGKHMINWISDAHNLSVLFAETDRDAVNFYRALGFRVESLGEKYPGIERFSCVLEEKVQQITAGNG